MEIRGIVPFFRPTGGFFPNFVSMRNLSLTLALLAGVLLPAGAYNDHRGHNVDSLERDRQILSLIAEGKTNPQIAAALFLSPETIKWYRKKLLAKFDVPTSAALVSKAKDMGLV